MAMAMTEYGVVVVFNSDYEYDQYLWLQFFCKTKRNLEVESNLLNYRTSRVVGTGGRRVGGGGGG